jgi:hypothetical protein
MSIDLIELGKGIGEAQATAEAALEVAEIAEAEATLAAVADADAGEADEGGHCGPGCPCHANQARIEAMLVALNDKYDEDMDVVSQALDLLLGDAEDEEEIPGPAVESVETDGSEPAADKPGAERDGTAGDSSDRTETETETREPEPEHRHRTPARRTGFARGRR